MKNKIHFLKVILFFFIVSFIFHSSIQAADLTSTNFIVRDPVIGTGGGFGTSASFQLFSEGDTIFTGVNDSLNFIGHYGFLYFPFFNSGVLSVTTTGSNADLTWTASSASSGWSVSGYRTGIASVSGGPYTYTNVGNVLSYSYTLLSAGNYCFIVETLDAFNNVIGTSNEDCVTVTGTGAGGGGGGGDMFSTGVKFSGQAYPFSSVFLLKGGNEVESTIANSNGYFNLGFEENSARNVIYTLFAIDVSGNKSLLINYPVVIEIDSIAYLNGVLFSPTVVTDKSTVKFGDYLEVSGYAIQNRELEIVIEGKGVKTSFNSYSMENGFYELQVPMGVLERGEYKVYVKYKNDSRISKLVRFTIGDVNVFNKVEISNIPGDCNFDRNINLVDFSILAFWYGKDNPPLCVDTNKDSIINLVDFSILAFYWTG